MVQRIQNLSDDLSGQSDMIDEGVLFQNQPRISHLLNFPPSKDTLTCVGEHDIERPDLSSPMRSLSKVLVVDDSAPSRKMLSRSGNAVLSASTTVL